MVILLNDVKTISSVKFSRPEDKMASKAAIRLIATIEEFQKSPACAGALTWTLNVRATENVAFSFSRLDFPESFMFRGFVI